MTDTTQVDENYQDTEDRHIGAVSWSSITDPTDKDYPEFEELASQLINQIFDQYPASHYALHNEYSIRFYLHIYKNHDRDKDSCIRMVLTRLESMNFFAMGQRGEDALTAISTSNNLDSTETRQIIEKFLDENIKF